MQERLAKIEQQLVEVQGNQQANRANQSDVKQLISGSLIRLPKAFKPRQSKNSPKKRGGQPGA